MGVKSNLATFTRPGNTTAYAAGDLVANSATANQVAAMSLQWGGGKLNGSLSRLRLSTTNATITNGSFHIWLFANDPSLLVTNGDNGALAGLSFSTYGLVHVAAVTLTASMGGVGGWGEVTYDPPGKLNVPGQLYALIEARAAYVPADSEVFSLQAEIYP